MNYWTRLVDDGAGHVYGTTPCPKKLSRFVFCQNFVKFLPISIIFGRKMGNDPNICEVHSFCLYSINIEQKLRRRFPRTDLAKMLNSRANKTVQNVPNHCISMQHELQLRHSHILSPHGRPIGRCSIVSHTHSFSRVTSLVPSVHDFRCSAT